MNRFFFSWIAGIITVLLLTTAPGCNDRLPTEPKENVIMPLAKGNMWIGTLTTFAEDGTIIGTTPDTILVTDAEEINGSTWYQCRAIGYDASTWYRNGNGGLWDGRRPTLEAAYIENEKYVFALYPAQEGDTTDTETAKVLVPDPANPNNPKLVDQIIVRYVEATDTVVTVPLGIYPCNLYRTRLLEPVNASFVGAIPWQYFAPNVGPVKIEWYQGGAPETGQMTQKWELMEVKLH